MLPLIDSAVIAAVIAGIVTIFMSRREAKLKYITEERQKWREKIREIAEQLAKSQDSNSTDTPSLDILLSELKVRINAYGVNLTEQPGNEDTQKIAERYKNDGHIWQVIRKIEAGIEVKKSCSRLVDYLSILLKHDWERAKNEAHGNPIFSESTVLCARKYLVIFMCSYVGLYLLKAVFVYNVFNMNIFNVIYDIFIVVAAGYLLSGVLSFVLYGISRKEDSDSKYIECLTEYDNRRTQRRLVR